MFGREAVGRCFYFGMKVYSCRYAMLFCELPCKFIFHDTSTQPSNEPTAVRQIVGWVPYPNAVLPYPGAVLPSKYVDTLKICRAPFKP